MMSEAQEMRVIEEDADLDQAKEINDKVKKSHGRWKGHE
jgi:hypothetical protein